VFIEVDGEIRQVKPDGSYDIWGTAQWAHPRYYTPDGRLIGISHDSSRIVEHHPNGTETDIATGLSHAFDVVGKADGTLFYNSRANGNLVRIDPDGTQHVVVEALWSSDLAFGPDGHLYAMGFSFDKFDKDTGARTTYPNPAGYGGCNGNVNWGDFIFTGVGEMLFVDATASQVGWLDINVGASGVLLSNEGVNSPAADIGPDEALYFGEWGCTAADPAQVVRLADDGSREVVVDGLTGFFWDMAFAPDGGLFFALDRGDGSNVLYHLGPEATSPVEVPGCPAGAISSLAVDPATGYLMVTESGQQTIKAFSGAGYVRTYTANVPADYTEFRLEFTPDGVPYAYVADDGLRVPGHFDRRVMRLDLAAGTSETVADFSKDAGYGHGGVGMIHADRDEIWLLIDPEFEIYRIPHGGSATLFAKRLPIDPLAVATDSFGDVYFTSPAGIFRLHQEVESGCAPDQHFVCRQ
jgi:streptogramin lyase